MSALGKILFKLTANSLVVANTGRPFSKRGLAAIVYGSLTTKAEVPDVGLQRDEFFGSAEDAKAEVLRLYTAKKNALSTPEELASQITQQGQTAQSYAGRALLELLQNAVDAECETKIGYKGVGFRSILKVTSAPEIHSDVLHVHWSPEVCEQALGGIKTPPSIVLSFPAWCNDPCAMTDHFSTVITLPLSPETRAELLHEWTETTKDPSLLVFIDGANEVQWESEGEPPKIWRRIPKGDLVFIEETVDGGMPVTQRWRLHHGETNAAMVAVLENEDGRFVAPPSTSTSKLRAFFPTDDANPFPNLIAHAEFPLTNDRKHIDSKHNDYATRISELVDAVKAAIYQRPVDDALDLLAHSSGLSTLVDAVQANVRDHPVARLRCCPEREQLPYSLWSDDARFRGWEVFKQCLSEFRGGLDGLGLLPEGTESKLREETLRWLNPSARLSKEELRALPWAPVEGSPKAVASLNQPLFELPKDESPVPSIPPGIQVHFLAREFQNALASRLGVDVARSLLQTTLGVLPFTLLAVVERAVLPAIKDGMQPDGTIDFLRTLWRHAGKDREKPFDWTDSRRAELIRECRVICEDGLPQAAEKVYATSDWTGSEFLERVYRQRPGYYFLHSPPEDENDRAELESFYRWLGVGWAPKVLPLVLAKTEAGTRGGLEWKDGQFTIDGPAPINWRGYCTQCWEKPYRDRDFAYRTPRLKLDWRLDGGEEIVETPGAFEIISSEWSYYSRYVESVGSTSSRQRQEYGQDNDNERKTSPSFFIWRLKDMRWLPTEAIGEVSRPSDVFRPGGVASSRALSGWVFLLVGDFPEKMADALGIRREWDELTLEDWRRWLGIAATLNPKKRIEDRESIRRLYACLLANAKHNDKTPPFKPSEVWWVERLHEREEWKLATVERANGAYLDRPEFEQLRLPGVFVFPARLDDKAAKAEAFFGMRRLSQRLKGIPQPSGAWPVHEMTQRIKDRAPYLIAYLGKSRNEQGREILKAALDRVKVTGAEMLKVTWSLDDSDLDEQSQSSFAHEVDGFWHLYLKTSGLPPNSNSEWERLAQVILLACDFSPTERASDVKDILVYDEAYLSEKLINLGVAPETVADAQRSAMESLQQPDIKTPPIHIPPISSGSGAPDSAPTVNVGKGPLVTPAVSPLTGITPPSTPPSGGNQRPHPETGLPAQEWLRESLINALAPANWEVSEREVIIEEGGSRIDIELRKMECESFYIEAKHTTGSTVFWSERQIETARSHTGRYFVALLRGTSELDYEVRWVFDPISEFQCAELQRTVSWTWKVRHGSGGIDANWQPSDQPPSVPADGFKAVITITPTFRAQLPLGIKALLHRINERSLIGAARST